MQHTFLNKSSPGLSMPHSSHRAGKPNDETEGDSGCDGGMIVSEKRKEQDCRNSSSLVCLKGSGVRKRDLILMFC